MKLRADDLVFVLSQTDPVDANHKNEYKYHKANLSNESFNFIDEAGKGDASYLEISQVEQTKVVDT